jgi:Zn-dependent peptidase ImmA (M78 family)/DNA-binding XRE family transcriptional regulator
MAATDLSAFDPKALWVARSFRGMTVSDLAREAGVSRQIASAIENRSAPPYRPALLAMATALRFPFEFFFTSPVVPDRSVFHFRRAASVPEHAIHQAMAHAALFASLAEGFSAFGRFKRARLPEVVPTSNDEIEAAAESFRAAIGLRPDTPIVNATRAVEKAGIFLGIFDSGAMQIDGYAWSERVPLIMLNKSAPWSRRRFSVMHEAGHIVMHRKSSPDDREQQAHRFAGAVLVPRAPFFREFPRPIRRDLNWAALIAMKERWGVSIQAIVHRAYDLGLIDAIQYRTANIHITKYGWKTQEPAEQDDPEEPELCTTVLSELHSRSKLRELCAATNLYEENVEQTFGLKLENLIEESKVIRIPPREPRAKDSE